ncbi:hypothetical protein KCU68_g2954, partial [Aureobasidium melanogenum]
MHLRPLPSSSQAQTAISDNIKDTLKEVKRAGGRSLPRRQQLAGVLPAPKHPAFARHASESHEGKQGYNHLSPKNEDKTADIEQLRDLLKARHEDSNGTKAELMRLLAISDAKSSRKYQNLRTNRLLGENGNRIRECDPRSLNILFIKINKDVNPRLSADTVWDGIRL